MKRGKDMKIVIIGGVAAGTSVGAKARRNNEDAEIVIYDRDFDVSYSICAIPYAVSGEVDSIDELTPRDAEWFKKRYNIDVQAGHEVTHIDHESQTIQGKNLATGEDFEDTYDTLVFANGSMFNTPPVFKGQSFSNVFQIKNIESGKAIKQYINENKPKTATIIGAGYIGLEMAEQLKELGLDVTILEFSDYPMPHLDEDMSMRVKDILDDNAIAFYGSEGVTELHGEDTLETVTTSQNNEFSADVFVVATGVKPNTELAESIGVHLGETGAIQINDKLETNQPHVYAVGDVTESYHVITKEPLYRPLATTANKMGRIAGDVITGGDLRFRGILGTSILRLFDQTIAFTGLSEKDIKSRGIEPVILTNIKPAIPKYMGGKEMVIKGLADPNTKELLGVQIIGPEGVDKRIDVFATAMTFNAKVTDLFHLDLAYAPPFSTTKDPVMYTGMALSNAMNKNPLITPEELIERQSNNETLNIIDLRSKKQFEESHVPGAVHIPLKDLREELTTFNKELPTIVYCNSGVSGNAGQNILLQNNFPEVYNISGGNKNYQKIHQK